VQVKWVAIIYQDMLLAGFPPAQRARPGAEPDGGTTMTAIPFGKREHTSSQRRADHAAGARVRWTEEAVSALSESDARLLMQMATLRSTPHDLFIIRWCTAHLRKLQDAVDYSDGTESQERRAP
jgi:hypothetical protein